MPSPLRYSATSYGPLAHNGKHQLAQRHALNIYEAQAIYSFIPKNACSTLRLSLALANGCIRDTKDFNWIHQNNGTFSASHADLARARYSFVVLRDPFSRLTSAYLDKIVDRNLDAWQYIDLHDRNIGPEDISFEFFIRSLAAPRVRNGNIHWRPQVDFLVYADYDDYFALEDFGHAVNTLQEKIGLQVVDARPLTNHQTSSFEPLDAPEPWKMPPAELLQHKLAGRLPTPAMMFNPELVEIVQKAYADDLSLYQDKCPSHRTSLCSKLP